MKNNMADPIPGNIDDNTKDIQAAKAEVEQKAQQAQSQAERNLVAQELINNLNSRESTAAEVQAQTIANKGSTPEAKKDEAKQIKASVVKIITAVDKRIVSPPAGSDEFFKIVISKKVIDKLTDSTASFIYPLIKKAVEGSITVEDLKNSHRLLKDTGISFFNSTLFDAWSEVLKETAKQLGMSEEEAKREFGKTAERQNLRGGGESEGKFEHDWVNIFNIYFNEEDKIVIKGLYSIEGLADLTEHIEEEQKQLPEFSSLDPEEQDKVISRELETRIILLFSKIYRRVDDEKQSQFMEELERQGFLDSMELARNRLARLIELLKNNIGDESRLPETLKRRKFYKRRTDDTMAERYITNEDEVKNEGAKPFSKRSPVSRSRPSLMSEDIGLTDFLQVVLTGSAQEIDSRRFNHNVGALLMKSADPEKGFWPQIASYADNKDSMDIDEMMHLPDNDISQAAFALYTKYLTDAFAKWSWINQSTMFSPQSQGVRSQIQNAVITSLKEMFPERLGKDEWRLKRAMSFGLGMARAVFITEEELASWADPHLTQESGGSTYQSYYYNDSTALNALNPMHSLLRWQSEQSMKGPILFSLISGFDSNPMGIWDHEKISKKMKQYRKTFERGIGAIEKGRPEERLFVELLANISRVGSIITRDGWRTAAAYEGWLDYKPAKDEKGNKIEGVESGDLNYLNSFKNLEYIGFEMMFDFINSKHFDNKDEGEKGYKGFLIEDSPDRKEFIAYLFTKYINPDINNLKSFLDKITPDVEAEVDRLVKKGRIRPGIRANVIEAEKYRRLIYRALAGVVAQRMPTKFAVLERDRTSKDGTRAWKKIMQDAGLTTLEIMEQSIQDLMSVEVELRREVSDEMNKHLQKGQKNFYAKKRDEVDFAPDYIVTEEAIKRILDKKLAKVSPEKKERRLENARKVFKSINLRFIINSDDNDDSENKHVDYRYLIQFAQKLRAKDAAGDIKDRYFPFAIATEELDTTFLAFKNAGPKLLRRAHADIGQAEMSVFKNIEGLLSVLNKVSVDPERKIDDIVKYIGTVQSSIESMINKDEANKLAYELASMTIAYFKKDTLARNIFTKWFRMGKKNSLAAEFTGTFRGAWEWDVTDIDRFIVALEQNHILPKEPFDLSKEARYDYVQNKIFGINFGKRRARLPDYQYTGDKLRREHGAGKGHITGEVLNKYLPLFLLFLLYKFISDALKKAEGKE